MIAVPVIMPIPVIMPVAVVTVLGQRRRRGQESRQPGLRSGQQQRKRDAAQNRTAQNGARQSVCASRESTWCPPLF